MDEFIAAWDLQPAMLETTTFTRHTGTLMLAEYTDVEAKLPTGFAIIESWCMFPYRVVWVNQEALTVVTYCEGDVTVTSHLDMESYNEEIAACRWYYQH